MLALGDLTLLMGPNVVFGLGSGLYIITPRAWPSLDASACCTLSWALSYWDMVDVELHGL